MMIRRLLLLVCAGFLVYLLWPYQVFELRHLNPRTTAFLQLRQDQAREAHRQLKPRMIWKPIGEISPNLIHAVLLAEDDTFYQHHGFDFEQMRIALAENIVKMKYAYGGSTITQQLARTLYLRPRKSLLRKAKEAVLTVYLEAWLSKKRILELYLNAAEWGPGIYGVEAAAQYYFHKPAANLTSDESVSLASILPSPRRWSPFSEKAFMARRRTQLTDRMQKAGYAPVTFLTGEEATTLSFDPDAVPGLSPESPPPAASTGAIVEPADPAAAPDSAAQPASPEAVAEPAHTAAPANH